MNLDMSIGGRPERLAGLFGALSDPTRLKIVRLLLDKGEVCVCELVERLRLGQSTVSHHMAILKQAGLVRGSRRGQWIDYRLTSPAAAEQAIALLRMVSAGRPQSRRAAG